MKKIAVEKQKADDLLFERLAEIRWNSGLWRHYSWEEFIKIISEVLQGLMKASKEVENIENFKSIIKNEKENKSA